jgi:hypothetical protein
MHLPPLALAGTEFCLRRGRPTPRGEWRVAPLKFSNLRLEIRLRDKSHSPNGEWVLIVGAMPPGIIGLILMTASAAHANPKRGRALSKKLVEYCRGVQPADIRVPELDGLRAAAQVDGIGLINYAPAT